MAYRLLCISASIAEMAEQCEACRSTTHLRLSVDGAALLTGTDYDGYLAGSPGLFSYQTDKTFDNLRLQKMK